MAAQPLVTFFKNIDKDDLPIVGGKGANLGEMTQAGFPVPNGFAITVGSYEIFLQKNQIAEKIDNVLKQTFTEGKTATVEPKDGDKPILGKELFSNKHYSQAIFEVCKLLNKRVQELSGSDLDGKKLMLDVFSVNNPKLKFNNVINQSEKDEQEGFMHLFAGLMHGVRNPKGHEIINLKDPYRALEYLGFISLLFRKLDELK